MPGKRYHIRIIAKFTQYTSVIRCYEYIGTIWLCTEDLHTSADILLYIPQPVFIGGSFYRLSAVMTDERKVMLTEDYLCIQLFSDFGGILIVVNVRVSKEDVAYIIITEPVKQMGICMEKSGIYKHIAVSAFYDIACNRRTACIHTDVIDIAFGFFSACYDFHRNSFCCLIQLYTNVFSQST